MRRVMSALLPQDSELSHQVQAAARMELARHGVRLTGATNAEAAAAASEKIPLPTLLSSVANWEKAPSKNVLRSPEEKGRVPGGAADVLFMESERLRQEAERLLAQSQQLKRESGHYQYLEERISG